MKRFCNEDCNNCALVMDKNSPMLTAIFNDLFENLGDEVYNIVQKRCPNLTVCFECRIDDFCHFEKCTIIKELEIQKSFPEASSGFPTPPCKPPRKENINRDLPHLKPEILSEGYDPAKPNPT